jgi:DNA-binding MarR family transcriptional regulator
VAEALGSDGEAALVYSFDDVLLLFADEEAGLARARAAAARAGCRIAAEAPIAGGAARLEQQIGADAALLSVCGASEELDSLLAKLGSAVRRGRMQGIVISTTAMIDAIFAADLPSGVEHLVDPQEAELDRALALTVARPPERLHDRDDREDVALLQQLSEEAARIATVLASLSGADPAFDMLLDLYAARLEGSRVAVSSLCIAAAVPATTALRWIKALTDQGLFVRRADPQDGRRVYIALSDQAAEAMGRYLSAVQRGGGTAL